MKRQRGWIPIPGVSEGVVKLVIVLGILIAAAALVRFVIGYVERRDAALVESGRQEERAKWQKREAKELAQANAEILRLQQAYTGLAHQQAAEVAAAHEDHQNNVRRIRDEQDRFVADVRAGRIVLRDPGFRGSTACKGAGDGPADGASAVAGGNAAAGGELSVEAGAFLSGLSSEADEVVVQLALAQSELAAMFKSCSATP